MYLKLFKHNFFYKDLTLLSCVKNFYELKFLTFVEFFIDFDLEADASSAIIIYFYLYCVFFFNIRATFYRFKKKIIRMSFSFSNMEKKLSFFFKFIFFVKLMFFSKRSILIKKKKNQLFFEFFELESLPLITSLFKEKIFNAKVGFFFFKSSIYKHYFEVFY